MSFGAGMAVAGGASLLGGLLSSQATSRGMTDQIAANERAMALQQAMADKQFEAQRPWREVGERALPKLENYAPVSMDGWEEDPGYRYSLEQGLLGVQGSQAARGMLKSGNTLRGLLDYGQNRAAQQYGDVYARRSAENTTGYNRLASLAGIGQASNNQTGQVQQNLGNTLANITSQQGQIAASGGGAQANAWGQALGGAAQALGTYYSPMNQWVLSQLPKPNK